MISSGLLRGIDVDRPVGIVYTALVMSVRGNGGTQCGGAHVGSLSLDRHLRSTDPYPPPLSSSTTTTVMVAHHRRRSIEM